LDADDTRRVERPQSAVAAGRGDASEAGGAQALDPDPGRNDHDAAAREELDVDAEARGQARSDAGEPRRWGQRSARRRMVRRRPPDRRRDGTGRASGGPEREPGEDGGRREPARSGRKAHRAAPYAILAAALLAGCGGSASGPAI